MQLVGHLSDGDVDKGVGLQAGQAGGQHGLGQLSGEVSGGRLDVGGGLGFGDGDLARIHAPIGLDIGSVSPAEIAVSVLAEIIMSLRKKPLRAEKAA